jgi:hypothetical protein
MTHNEASDPMATGSPDDDCTDRLNLVREVRERLLDLTRQAARSIAGRIRGATAGDPLPPDPGVQSLDPDLPAPACRAPLVSSDEKLFPQD